MKVRIVFLKESVKAAFYSAEVVRDDNRTEEYLYKDFVSRMTDGGKNEGQLNQINRYIQRIFNEGAKKEFFGSEGIADRLPPPKFHYWDSDGVTDWGLRLYCLRVEGDCNIIILLNGDRKTSQNPRDCPNCKPHFNFAVAFATAFYDSKMNGDIEIEGNSINTDENFLIDVKYRV